MVLLERELSNTGLVNKKPAFPGSIFKPYRDLNEGGGSIGLGVFEGVAFPDVEIRFLGHFYISFTIKCNFRG